MTKHFRNLLVTWVLLLVLLGAEFGASFLPLARSARPLILIPVVLMVAAVATMFMQVGRGPTIVRLFAVAALRLAERFARPGQLGSDDANRISRPRRIPEVNPMDLEITVDPSHISHPPTASSELDWKPDRCRNGFTALLLKQN